MVGRVFEHFGLVRAHRFCTNVGTHFICQGNDRVAVFGGQFLEFEGLAGFGGWPGIHDFSFSFSVAVLYEFTQLVDIFH